MPSSFEVSIALAICKACLMLPMSSDSVSTLQPTAQINDISAGSISGVSVWDGPYLAHSGNVGQLELCIDGLQSLQLKILPCVTGGT